VVPTTDDQAELFQVVDADDRPVAVRTRAECHADPRLIHRSVFVVISSEDGMLFQQRGLGKDTYPGYWCMSCAGHVAAGESYEEAARRELQEEVGVDGGHLELAGTLLMRLPDETEMGAIFRLRHGGPFIVRPPEVIGLATFPAGDPPAPLTPSAVQVLDFLQARP
jgi:8-oxo-dGTP pyrophosphatase MutT (NUDIX family)